MSKRRRTNGSRPERREKLRDVFVARPFQGLPGEAEWVALRELIPAATAPLRLTGEYAQKYPDREVTVATVLPMAWPAMVKQDGGVLIGLQRQFQSGDLSRDLAASLQYALETEPGKTVGVPSLPGPGPRLQDMIALDELAVTLHTSFEFWVVEGATEDPTVASTLEQANASIYPTERLTAAPAAYWCQVPDKAHVRWVLPDDEDPALNALARLSAAGGLALGDGTRFAGMFRAHGLLVPVWDVPPATPGAEWNEPLATVVAGYRQALATDAPLTPAERRSRQGLLGRQLTLR